MRRSAKVIENELYNFLNDKMITGDTQEIKSICSFEDYFYTSDDGIVIDCVDGTQIILTIQTR